MDYEDLNLLEMILIPIAVIAPMALWYYSFIIYQKYFLAKGNANEKVDIVIFGDDGGGQLTSDGFGMRPPLPIEDRSDNLEVQIYVKKYNKIVKIFWIGSILGWTIIIIGLNLIRHYNLLSK